MRLKTTIAAIALLAAGAPARASNSSNFTAAAATFGVAAFVDQNCPTMRPNWIAVRTMVEKAGVDLDDEEQKKLIIAEASLFVATVERSQYATFCRTAWGKFGANGSVSPDVFLRR